jgi:hypothetical protein
VDPDPDSDPEPEHRLKLNIFFVWLQDEQLALLVDPVLETEDRNRDGFIDYPEYIAATLKQRIKDKQRAVHHTAS